MLRSLDFTLWALGSHQAKLNWEIILKSVIQENESYGCMLKRWDGGNVKGEPPLPQSIWGAMATVMWV